MKYTAKEFEDAKGLRMDFLYNTAGQLKTGKEREELITFAINHFGVAINTKRSRNVMSKEAYNQYLKAIG